MKKIHNKIQVNIFFSLLLLILGAALIVYFSFYFICGSEEQLLDYYKVIDSSLIFNYVPVLLIAVIFSLLFGNVFYGLSITVILVDIFAYADHYMIKYRGEPLAYGDIFSLKEGLSAVNHFSIEIDIQQLCIIIAVAVVLAFLGFVCKNRKKLPLRIIASAFFIFAFCFTCKYMYSSDFPRYNELMNREELAGEFNHNIRVQMVGPVFFFIDSYKDYTVEKPENYDKNEFKNALAHSVTADSGENRVLPDVIMVACECFSDLPDIDFFNYTSYTYTNPNTEFHKLCDSVNSYKGYIYTPVYGGGTCNTELEVLRSMFIRYSSDNMSKTVHGEKDSIVTRFEEYGYHTTYIHPGDEWFYNRQNVMKNLGFDETYFMDDFKNPEYLHQMISDKSVADFIIEKYKEQNNEGSPVFMNAMTIAGHFPFYWEMGMPFVPINGELESESYAEISMYLQRMSETNQMMAELSSYFSNVNRPVILVFYGDHLPSLGENCSLYKDIGYPLYDEENNELPRKYKIPYVIWGNNAAASYFENGSSNFGISDFGAPYLGVSVLNLIGLAQGYPYYDFLLDLKKDLPVIHGKFYIDGKGEMLKDIPEQYQKQIDTLKKWNYYYLKDN